MRRAVALAVLIVLTMHQPVAKGLAALATGEVVLWDGR